MAFYNTTKLAALMGLTFGIQAVSAHQCNSHLVQGVFNQYLQSKTTQNLDALKDYYCAQVDNAFQSQSLEQQQQDLQNMSQLHRDQGGSGSYTRLQDFQKAYCEDRQSSTAGGDPKQYLTEVATPRTITGWQKCRADNEAVGLSCVGYRAEYGHNYISLHLNNNHPYQRLRNVKMTGVNLQFLTKAYTYLGYGSFRVAVDKIDRRRQATFSLEGTTMVNGKKITRSCGPIIPLERDANGKWQIPSY